MASDGRPLPPGWSAHRDERTGSMFYVNHSSQPATMSYAHPLDSAPQAAAVQQQVAAPPPQLAHSIEYASRYTPSPQPSVSSGRSGSTGGHPGAADRAQPPGTVRELHTVATPPSHSRSVSMSTASYAHVPPPPPPPRLASNPNRTSTYTPRLPPVQVQPVQQQQPQQQQQPSRVSALYAAQAGVQPAKTGGRWSSFFGTAKSQPFQQQIVPLQQSASRPPPATIYQQQQRPPIVTQPFQQQCVSQQFVPQQQQFVPQQQQTVPQQQQLVPQQQQIVPQQQHSGHQQQFTPQQQVQPASAQQQFVAQQQHLVAQQPHQHQLSPQQMQTLPQLAPQVSAPQQQQMSLPPQQVVVPQQQQAGGQQNVAPPGALDPQVLLQLSALLAQQQGVEQAQILQQLLIAQQQLQPVSPAPQFAPAQAQQVPSPSHSAGVATQAENGHGGIPVTAPQPVHAVPAQPSLGLSPSPSPQSPQASLAQAHAAYAPGLGLYTAQQASPPSAVGSPPAPLPQSVTESPVLSALGFSSFDAAFPVDASRSPTSTPADAAVRPDSQGADYQQDIGTSAEAETAPVLRPEFGAQEESSFVPAIGRGEAEENGADSPGPLPAYSLEPPNSAPPMVDSFVAEAILQEMAQAAAELVVEAVADSEAPAQSVEVPVSVELSQPPAPVESFQSPVSPTQYTPGGRTVRPALPPRPSGPRADRRLAGHAVSSHVSGGAHHSSASPAHGPAAASPTVLVPVAHAAHPTHQNGGPVTPAHAASPPPSISSPNGALPQSHGPAHCVQSGSYQPAMGVPPVGTLTAQTAHAQYLPAQQNQQQSPVQQQQQQHSPVCAQQQQQQQSHVPLQQQQHYPQQQQQQQQSGSPPPPPPKPYAVYPDPGRQQSIGGRLSSFMSSPATQAIAAKGAGLLGNLFVRTAVNAVTDSDTASNYGYLNTGPSATDVAAGIAGNVVQNAIQQSIAPTPQPGLAGTPIAPLQAGLAGTTTQTQLIQAQIQAQAQANTNALLQSMQGSQQAQTAAALLQAQKIQAANAQATLQAQQQQQQQQQNVQAQLAALLKMQQQQQSAQQQAVLQHVQQQQAAQQAQQQEALQEAQQQAALQQAQQQAMLQQAQQQQAAQQAQQQAMLQQLQQQNDAQQQAALEQLQQQAAMYQTQQQAALEQMQTQTVFAPQVFASTNYEQPNGSGMDTLAQTISQAMSQQSTGVDPYSQAFSPDGGMTQTQIQGSSSDSDFLGALSQAIMGGVQTVSYDPSAYAGDVQSGADPSAMQAMTDALSQMQLGSEQMISGGFDGPQQTGYSQFFSSFTTSDIIDSAVANSV